MKIRQQTADFFTRLWLAFYVGIVLSAYVALLPFFIPDEVEREIALKDLDKHLDKIEAKVDAINARKNASK